MSHRRLHIVLIGFMGSGKSTIGLLLAEHLKISFIDLDYQIEVNEGSEISEVFATRGENYFRKVEQKTLKTILVAESPTVIATGGGTPCFFNGMEEIQRHSISFYLKVGKSRLLKRLHNDVSRPLIAHKTNKQLKEFIDESLREREKVYKRASHTILAYDQPERVVSRILKYLDRNNL
jgi:shikimate kinase